MLAAEHSSFLRAEEAHLLMSSTSESTLLHPIVYLHPHPGKTQRQLLLLQLKLCADAVLYGSLIRPANQGLAEFAQLFSKKAEGGAADDDEFMCTFLL